MDASLDHRVGALDHGKEWSDVDLAAAIALVEKLDSNAHTLACFRRKDDRTLMIGGGPQRTVVGLIDPDGNSVTLCGDGSGPRVPLCAGGQWADFEAGDTVERSRAIECLRRFFAGDEQSLGWRPD
ncbi:MAG: hypothetical protein HKO95_18625 [Rhodobacteraceae bacterium]|nr:hypothetical protein [Alphaproteobacteria bacterium]NNK68744.1 hypothetical protein [Paracoccaceae bacterium]